MAAHAYYNEIDPHAAQWLRNLIAAGVIAPGDVDERSIEDVRPVDLRGYTQCHFFAGIGVWSYALRRAGWRDDRAVWTGSCPCQPFSAAGKGDGFADERHLWPTWYYLIEECRPPVVIGEQVASKDADPWIDLVQDDMEALDYAFGAVPFPSAGVGAPHIRDRLYWMADADGMRQPRFGGRRQSGVTEHRADGGLGNTDAAGLQMRQCAALVGEGWREEGRAVVQPGSASGGLADAALGGRGEERPHAGGLAVGDRAQGLAAGLGAGGSDCRPGPTNGLWRDADWLLCRDGKWRPVEPSTFPLAHGAPARVGRLRAYGNAINAEAAIQFIGAYLDHDRAIEL